MNPAKILIQLGLNIDGVKSGLAEVKKEFGGFKDAASEAAMTSGSEFREFANKIGEAGASMATVGSDMTKKFTVPIVGGLGLAINEARKFESSFAGIKKTVDATDQQFARLEEQMKRLSTRIPADVNEINKVAEAAGQLGIGYEDIEKFTEVMINLGVATNLSADQAATQFARLQNIMGFSPDDYESLGSVVVDLGNNFATSESEIMNFTMRLAPMGAQAGLTTPEIMGISTAFTSMGLTAEAGGTAAGKMLSMMSLSSTKGLGQMQTLEKQLGMTGREMELLSSSNSNGFKALADSVGMTSTELSQVIKANKDLKNFADISGVSIDEFADKFQNNAAGALDLFFQGLQNANLEGEDVIEMLADMGINEVRLRAMFQSGAAGADVFSDALKVSNDAFEQNTALQIEADKRYETLDSQLQLAANSMKVLAINLGEQMIPYIKQFAEWIAKLADRLAGMSPKEFQSLVKAAVGLAAIGPGLSIVGKAFMLFDKSVKGVNALSEGFKKLSNGYKNMATVFKKVDVGSIIEGNVSTTGQAWSKDLLDMISGRTNSHGKAISSSGQFLPQDPALVKKYLDQNASMVSSTQNLKNASVAVTTSGLFTMAGFAGLFIYLKKSYDSSMEFRAGLKAMGDMAKEIGSTIGKAFAGIAKGLSEIPLVGELTAWATSLSGIVNATDLLVIAVGLLGASFGFLNPYLGAAMAAFGAFKILTSWVGEFKLLEPLVSNTGKAVESFNARMESTESSLDIMAVTSLPLLDNAFEGIQTTIDGFTAENFNTEIKTLQDQTTSYTKTITDDMTSAHNAQKKVIDDYWIGRGEADSEGHKADLERNKANWEEKKLKVTETSAEIQELLKKHEEGKTALTDEELILINEHYAKLETAATEHYVRLAEQQTKQLTNRIDRVRELGIPLEGKYLEDTLAMLEENLNKKEEINYTYYRDREDELKTDIENGKITQAEADAKMLEARTQYYLDSQELQTRFFADTLMAQHGFDLTELTAYSGHNQAIDKLKLESHELGKKIFAEKDLDAKNQLIEEQKDLDAKIKMHEKEREELGITKANYKTYSEALGKQSTDVKNSVATYSETVAKAVSKGLKVLPSTMDDVFDGVQEAIKVKGPGPISQMGRWAQNLIQNVKDKFKSKSPSKVFIGIGGDLMDGMTLGLEDGQGDVMKVMSDINDDMIGAIDPSMGVDLSRSINTEFGFSGESKLAKAVAKAVATELAKVTVRATIDEDDFNSGVRETLRNDMSR